MPSTTKGYPYPAGTEAISTGDDAIAALANFIDGRPGVAVMTTVQRNALVGAANLWQGRVIWNTTTKQIESYDGAVWNALALSLPHPFLIMGA